MQRGDGLRGASVCVWVLCRSVNRVSAAAGAVYFCALLEACQFCDEVREPDARDGGVCEDRKAQVKRRSGAGPSGKGRKENSRGMTLITRSCVAPVHQASDLIEAFPGPVPACLLRDPPAHGSGCRGLTMQKRLNKASLVRSNGVKFAVTARSLEPRSRCQRSMRPGGDGVSHPALKRGLKA
jgi:hypothetical protein